MDEKRLPFLAHLEELRTRITRSLLGLVVGVVVCFIFHEQIFDFVAQPLVSLKENPGLHIKTPTEAFFVYLKLALVAGLALAAPFILLQLWLFVAPGLFRHERRLAVAFVFFGSIFFFGGIAFAYYIVFPFGFEYLLDFAYGRASNFSILDQLATVYDKQVDWEAAGIARVVIKPTIMMEDYVSLVVKLLLAFGLIFELPLVLYFLARVGLVNHRSLWRFFKYWVVIAFLLAAILTPPDVMTQSMMAVPLILMYLAGIVVAFLVGRRREARQRREAAELGYDDDDEYGAYEDEGEGVDAADLDDDDRDDGGDRK